MRPPPVVGHLMVEASQLLAGQSGQALERRKPAAQGGAPTGCLTTQSGGQVDDRGRRLGRPLMACAPAMASSAVSAWKRSGVVRVSVTAERRPELARANQCMGS